MQIRRFFTILFPAVILAGVISFFLINTKTNAQTAKITRMRCTQLELAGAKAYDIVSKKLATPRRKVYVNRCVMADVICYHTFDQGGALTCVKR